MTGDQTDWRCRAVAHARALVSMLVTRPVRGGTFGETWLQEAQETVRLDFNEEPFASGRMGLHKDGTLPDSEELLCLTDSQRDTIMDLRASIDTSDPWGIILRSSFTQRISRVFYNFGRKHRLADSAIALRFALDCLEALDI